MKQSVKRTKLNIVLLVFIIGIYILLSFITGKLLSFLVPTSVAVAIIFLVGIALLYYKGPKKIGR